jgi:SAM-dependent methyltransferase
MAGGGANDAQTWDERYRGADLLWGAEPNQFVRRLCERLPVGDAVELACGEGRNALWLARLGWRVLGVDFSVAAIERAEALTAAEPEDVRLHASWRVGDVVADPPRPRRHDLVLICYLHIAPSDFGQVLRAAARSVRPHGRLVVVGHDRRNLAEGVGGPQDLDRLYDPDRLASVATEEGLVVEVGDTVERPTGDGTALDSILRARRPPLP